MWRPQLGDDELVIRYLLGKASEQEQQRLEERYFGDDQFFEHLQALEEELIDAYVNDQLPADERKSFEEGFLASPERRQRVEFAKALLQTASRKHAAQAARSDEKQALWARWPGFWRVPQPVMQLAFTAALVVLGLGGGWLLVQSLRLRDQLAQTVEQQTTLQREGQTLRAEVEQQRSLSQQLNGELERERAERSRLESLAGAPRIVASFILTPNRVRSLEASRPFLIRAGTDSVQFHLDLEADDYPSYRAVLRTADDEEVWSQDGLSSQRTLAGKAVRLSLPASLLTSGDYLLTLRGVTARGDIEDAGQYVFKVVRR